LGTHDVLRVLPLSALFGAVLLTAADLIGQLIFFPIEMPAGIFTVLLGGPILLLMLRGHASGNRS
jgi:iron complex transport system permease protein